MLRKKNGKITLFVLLFFCSSLTIKCIVLSHSALFVYATFRNPIFISRVSFNSIAVVKTSVEMSLKLEDI